MKSRYKQIFNLTLTAAALALFTWACTQPGTPGSSGSTISNANYSAPAGANIPTRYERVTGVALYSVAAELKEKLTLLADKTPEGSDRFFVLLNPKLPTEGILVRAPHAIDTTPENLSNHRLAITGNVVAIDKTDSGLTECFVEKYGFSLAGDAQKRPIYIDAEIIDDPDAKSKPEPAGQTAAPEAAENGNAGAAEKAPEPAVPAASVSEQPAQPAGEAPAPITYEAAPASSAAASGQTAPAEADKPADIAVRDKSHSLNVTPMAPKAKAAAETKAAEPQSSAAAVPAPEQTAAETAAKTETAANIEVTQEPAAAQDIAPTAQPLQAPPAPQDVAPTSQPLE